MLTTRARAGVLAGALALGTIVACGCGGTGDPGSAWRPLVAAELDPVRATQRDRALAARDALFGELFRTLQATMTRGGPEAAIAVCRERAPEIAARVSTEHGLRIGRTSFRLRNPDNRPPPWAEPWIERHLEEPLHLAGPRGELGVLLPIRTAAPCLACHGPADRLAPGVAAALDRIYPDDRGTGFAEGDLRGWFWVEVPG